MNSTIFSNTLETLVPIICEHTGFRPEEVLPSMRLHEDLCIDSLALHAILMDVEETWGVMPGIERMGRTGTLAGLAGEIAGMRSSP